MARDITWSLHSETGNWLTSYNLGRIGDYLNYLGNYWDIKFTRNNNGRIKFILARSPNPNWAGWTNGFTSRINNAFNFNVAGTVNRDMICAKLACHEFGHMCRPGGSHAGTPSLMDVSATMPTGNLSQVDYWWFDVYSRKPGALRPHEEPNRMRKTFIPGFVSAASPMVNTVSDHSRDSLGFGCNHSAPWYKKLIPSGWIKP